MISRKLCPLALFLACAFGCGGGGGGGAPIFPTTSLRSFQNGDSYTWALSGSESTRVSSFAGTKTITVSSTTFNGNPALDFATTFNIVFQTGPYTATNHDIKSQDAQGLHELSSTMSGGPLNVTSDTYTQPAMIGINTVASGKTTFSDGSFVNTSIRITGKERVIVPAGTFDCWKANYSWSDSRGDTETDVIYIDQALGFPVESIVYATNGQGSNVVDSFTLELKTTNVTPAIAHGSGVNFRNIGEFAQSLSIHTRS